MSFLRFLWSESVNDFISAPRWWAKPIGIAFFVGLWVFCLPIVLAVAAIMPKDN